MKQVRSELFVRSAIALVILLAGVAMAPFVDLPKIRLGWQRFAGVYEANLDSNYSNGQPGSYFLFNGSNYPPNQTADILVNGELVGQVMTNGSGQVSFIISTVHSPVGVYTVTASVNANASGSDSFTLETGAPLRGREGNAPIFNVQNLIYMPLMFK